MAGERACGQAQGMVITDCIETPNTTHHPTSASLEGVHLRAPLVDSTIPPNLHPGAFARPAGTRQPRPASNNPLILEA
jgi:hypothetical protein